MRKGKVSVVLIIMGVLLLTTPQASVAAWYDEPMANAISLGCFEPGVNPEATASRYDIVEALWKLDGQTLSDFAIPYQDVDQHQLAIAWATEKGIVKGYSNDRFGGNDNVTREQMAVILGNYAKTYNVYATPHCPKSIDVIKGNFDDAYLVSDWAKQDLAWSYWVGLFVGSNRTINPKGNLTIAELASLINQTHKILIDPIQNGIGISPTLYEFPFYYREIVDYGISLGWSCKIEYFTIGDSYGDLLSLDRTNDGIGVLYFGDYYEGGYFIDSSVTIQDDFGHLPSQQEICAFILKHN